MADGPSASGDEPSGIYEPLLPPYQLLTDANRGPLALVTATTLLIITTLTVSIKVWTIFATTRKLGFNDITMISSIAFGIGYTICLCQSVNNGLGRVADDLDASQIESLSKNYFASNILLVLSIASAKAAVTLLVIAIKPLKGVMYACYGVLAFSGIWGVASAIALSLQCSPNRWALGPSDTDTCVDQYTMQIAIRICDIISDIAIIVLPIVMMQSVQTTPGKRWMVIMLFSLRIVTPILTAVSIGALSGLYDASLADRPYQAITPSIWTTAALNLSIITACIPSIKRFLADWAAGLSKAEINDAFELEHSAGKSHSGGGGNASYATGSGLGSKLATKLGLSSSSRAEVTSISRSRDRDRDHAHDRSMIGRRTGQQSPSGDTSDSVKGLTDGVIMHTIDYKVEYEDGLGGGGGSAGMQRNGSTSSSSGPRERERHPYERGAAYEIGRVY